MRKGQRVRVRPVGRPCAVSGRCFASPSEPRWDDFYSAFVFDVIEQRSEIAVAVFSLRKAASLSIGNGLAEYRALVGSVVRGVLRPQTRWRHDHRFDLDQWMSVAECNSSPKLRNFDGDRAFRDARFCRVKAR
jgi:hypothetical protein